MLALYGNFSQWIPVAVLLASLAGSAHCVSMCGGLVIATVRSRRDWITYHLGRLVGYLGFGAGAGLLGAQVLSHSSMRWASWGAAIFLSLGFMFAGIQVWQGKLPHLALLPKRFLMKAYQRSQGHALATGFLTAFLPCGWLHAFVLGAVATQSAILGSLFLLMFWLGTLPALAGAPWLITRLFRPFSHRAPKVAAFLLIFAGLLCLGSKIAPILPIHSFAHEQSGAPSLCAQHPDPHFKKP